MEDGETIPYMSLYRAVVENNWIEVKKILDKYPDAARAKLSTDEGTTLHTAVLHRQEFLVRQLVELVPEEDLELSTTWRNGTTALHIAATGTNVRIAEFLVAKNRKPLRIPNGDGYIPVSLAALHGNEEMLMYLYSETPEEVLNPETGKDGATLLSVTLTVENYGFALELLARFPRLAITKDVSGRTCLNVLAKKQATLSPFTMPQKFLHRLTGLVQSTCNLLAIRGAKQINETSTKQPQLEKIFEKIFEQHFELNSMRHLQSIVMPAMFEAIETGNVEFVIKMIRFDPSLLWTGSELGSIFHEAVRQRQVSVWNLIYSTGDRMRYLASIEDKYDNNILHVAGMLAPFSKLNNISGPAMQIQWELQWFKAVNDLVRPMLREQHNREGKTPYALFVEQHKELAEEGKKWMKDTATSCMVVSTLITTITFQASTSISLGTSEEVGKSLHSREITFRIYMFSVALSLVFSNVSTLMFLSILTSSYSFQDFLVSLPNRLNLGIGMLFLSIETMMFAFLFSFYLTDWKYRGSWEFSLIILLVGVPVGVYACSQLPLYFELIKLSYRSPLFNPQKVQLFPRDAPLIRHPTSGSRGGNV